MGLRIRDGSMEVLRGDLVVIRDTRRGGLYKMVGTVESAFTVVFAGTPTWRVVGDDDMTSCSGAASVEICHMEVSFIA
jgi:hypothetical protein